MTNWKLLLRKYIAHVRHWEGVDYLDEPPSSRDPFPLSADELSVLRELSEQTTESVAAEQAAAASLPDDREPITADWWREQDNVNEYGTLELSECVSISLVKFKCGIDMHLVVWEDQGCMETTLHAVRTRGDVRTLARLLGRE